MEAPVARETTRYQDALRILFLLVEAGEPIAKVTPPAAVRVIHSEMRLQALDFWMRNPDYLADELLNLEANGAREDGLALAKSVLANDEPELRRYPMVRWHFGAYEPLDDALAVLRTSALIEIRREGSPASGHVREHHFFLLEKGAEVADAIVKAAPALGWYRSRAHLVASVAGADLGSKLKERQYERLEYARTKLGSLIRSIAADVQGRIGAIETSAMGRVA